MKTLYIIVAILTVTLKGYSCSKEFRTPVYLDTVLYVLFTGKVISINNAPCDTVDDTITLRDTDSLNGDSQQFKNNKIRLKIFKFLGEEKIILNDSQTVLRKIKCEPSEIVVIPIDVYTLPPGIDTISVYRYGLAADCSSPPVRILDKKLLNDIVLVGGSLSQSSSGKKQPVYLSSLDCTDFFVCYPTRYSYNFKNVVKYKTTGGIDLRFELSKDLIRLYREKDLEKRIEIMKNLKDHKYYSDDRSAFRKVFSMYFSNYSKELQEKIFRKIHE